MPDVLATGLKVYIAAPYPWRDSAIHVMRQLVDVGVQVTSTWLVVQEEMADASARVDLADVARADVLIAINPPGWEEQGTGGRHVELGYALALKRPVVLVGQPSNVFHYLDDIVRVPSCGDLVATLLALQPRPTSTGALADTALDS